MTAEWVRTVVIRSVVVVVTVTTLSEVISLVVKDEVELYTNVNEGLLEPSVKCDDVPMLLDNSLLLSVKDCEGDSKVDCEEDNKRDREEDSEGDSKTDCEGDNEEDFEGDGIGDCEKVGEGDGEEIASSSVD